MIFYISDEFLNYEAGNLFRIFYPYDSLTIKNEKCENADFSIEIIENKALIKVFDKEQTTEIYGDKKQIEVLIDAVLYKMLEEKTGYSPKWGMLTGIHPVKLFGGYVKDLGMEKAEEHFKNVFMVADDKIELSKTIYNVQKPFIDDISENDFSLYVSIPFCPSRCSYCSFVSQSVEKSDKLIAPYLVNLLKEIEYTGEVVKKNSLVLKSVYIGGGTPTTLDEKQLETLIEKIYSCFDFEKCTEFTVEAGRPDTITQAKLDVLKKLGIERISINPQSLNDEVLRLIGRKHDSQEVLDKYNLARETGFKVINTDMIAGLQGDTFESFANTLNTLIDLKAENITVHSLALKRSAEIFRKENTQSYHSDKDTADKMVEYSIKRLMEEGYVPYYLYRQSRMAGNCENTGWCKPGLECAYNIYTMDESQTVIACGAGAVTKLKDPYSNRLERVFNFKYSYEYLDRFNEMLERKDEVTRLYEQFRKRLH